MVNKQRGFTLVEIAIVLVIIGLLLGGILKGQELITAARVRNFADQAASVQAAYYGFIDRYRAVPGDMPATQACGAIGTATMPSCEGGDGDQVIASFGEAAAAWLHMAAAGFLQGSYSGTAADATAYTAGAPPAAPTNPWNGFLLLGRSAFYLPTTPTQPLRLHLIVGRQVPVTVMRELDVKVDDSQPTTGILRSAPATAGTYPGNIGGSVATCVTGTTPTIWNIDGAAVDCNGYFLY